MERRRGRPMTSRCARRRRGVVAAGALCLLASGCLEMHIQRLIGDQRTADAPSWMPSPPFLFCAASADAEGDAETMPRPLNYYELLNLEQPDTHRRPRTGALQNRKRRTNARARITTDQIKKAYRKQAQLFHPDKASRNNMTTEEATSRFAGIAEAYKTLTDPAERYEYDWELLEDEDEYEEARLLMEEERKESQRHERQHNPQMQSLYDSVKNGASNFNAWKDSIDPWSVFEDFFFQDPTMDQHAGETRYQGGNAFDGRQHAQIPPLVSETTIHRGYDATFGADIFSVLHREEYISDPNENGEYFYRIHGQDFVQNTRVDPYTGFIMQEYYSAVTEPYLVDEGYAKPEGDRFHSDEDFRYDDEQHEREAKSQTTRKRKSPTKLEEGEYITPSGSVQDPWISPNGKYQAALSRTCELSIVRRDDDDTVIWSSDTYIPSTRADGCHLTMNSVGQLVLSVDYGSGLVSLGNSVLWSTPVPPVAPHLFEDGDATNQSVIFSYYASLDDDGVIAVYRIRERAAGTTGGEKRGDSRAHPTPSQSDTTTQRAKDESRVKLQIRNAINTLGGLYQQISDSSAQQGQTKAALTWDHLRYNVGRVFAGRPLAASTDAKEKHSRHECIYSTSPVGCLAPGRNAIRVTKQIGRSLKRGFQAIDTQLDSFVSSLTEPASDYDYDDQIYGYDHNYDSGYEEEDDDILDTLLRVTGVAGAAGAQIGKAGIHVAHMGMKRGKNVAGKVVGKMKHMGKQSTRWGDGAAEDEEVNRFF